MNLSNAGLMRRAINKWGSAQRLDKLQEECGELIAAISHLRMNRLDAREEVIGELADVLLTVQGVMEMMRITADVKAELDRKAAQLEGLLD